MRVEISYTDLINKMSKLTSWLLHTTTLRYFGLSADACGEKSSYSYTYIPSTGFKHVTEWTDSKFTRLQVMPKAGFMYKLEKVQLGASQYKGHHYKN
jgi:hypothetical protein